MPSPRSSSPVPVRIFGIDRLAVGRQPFVPFVQHFQGAVNPIVRTVISAQAKRIGDTVFLLGL